MRLSFTDNSLNKQTLTCGVLHTLAPSGAAAQTCRGGAGSAYLICPGTPLEGHLPHVFAVIFRNTTRPDQSRHQVIFDGLEL